MANSITFGGVTSAVPNSYSQVDVSDLTQIGLTATGRVALLGTAVGGRPYTAIQSPSDFVTLTQPSQAKANFKSGDLLEAAAIAFDPSSDANILGGAQQVIAMKINPSTQATANLAGDNGPSIAVTSLDYGTFANHIGVQVAQGSQTGLQLTITGDDVVESVDNLGGAQAFSLTYNGGTHGYTGMLAKVDTAGNVSATGTVNAPSLASDITTQLTVPAGIGIGVNDENDIQKVLTVYGLDADGKAVVATQVLGLGAPDTIFSQVLGAAVWSGTVVGDVEIYAQTDNSPNILTIKAGKQFAGVQPLSYGYVAQTTVSAKASGLNPVSLMVVPAGDTTQAELLTLTGGVSTTSKGSYAQLGALVTGGMASQSAVVTAKAVATDSAMQKTVGQVIAYFDARSASVDGVMYGFDAEVGAAGLSAPALQLDAQGDTDCAKPATAGFGQNLYSIVNWINNNSRLVSASVPAGAQGAPKSTATPVFLAGGSEGIATFQDYQNALNLLQQVSVDWIVPLSCDPDMAAALDAHCAYMNSPKGANERAGFVGLMNADSTGLATKKEALAQAQALNTRNLSCVPMSVVRYDTTGNLKEFSPAFAAVLAAGMASGLAVGRSLTRKYAKAQAFKNHPSWSTQTDADEMLQGGLLFTRLASGRGNYWVRDLTSYLQQDNLAYQERGVNYACNYVVRDLRNACVLSIGMPAFANSEAALQSVLKGRLDTLVAQGVITTYQSPVVRQVNDTFFAEVSVAPTLPINFVLLTLGVSATTDASVAAAA